MPSEKTDAIVIRTVEFSETSLVVTLFTRDFGKVGALAKGARRPKNPFDSALDLLGLCRIVFLRKSSDVLDLVTEAKLQRRFRVPGRDLRALYAGYYVAELLAELTHDDDPHPELFDVADRTLADLSSGGPVGRVVLRFELQALRTLGHLPSLSVCAACGSAVPSARRFAFGLLDGGVLCDRCRGGRSQVASISADALRTMAELADPAVLTRDPPQTPRGVGGELRGLLNRYLANLLGHQPRMHRYLGTSAD